MEERKEMIPEGTDESRAKAERRSKRTKNIMFFGAMGIMALTSGAVFLANSGEDILSALSTYSSTSSSLSGYVYYTAACQNGSTSVDVDTDGDGTADKTYAATTYVFQDTGSKTYFYTSSGTQTVFKVFSFSADSTFLTSAYLNGTDAASSSALYSYVLDAVKSSSYYSKLTVLKYIADWGTDGTEAVYTASTYLSSDDDDSELTAYRTANGKRYKYVRYAGATYTDAVAGTLTAYSSATGEYYYYTLANYALTDSLGGTSSDYYYAATGSSRTVYAKQEYQSNLVRLTGHGNKSFYSDGYVYIASGNNDLYRKYTAATAYAYLSEGESSGGEAATLLEKAVLAGSAADEKLLVALDASIAEYTYSYAESVIDDTAVSYAYAGTVSSEDSASGYDAYYKSATLSYQWQHFNSAGTYAFSSYYYLSYMADSGSDCTVRDASSSLLTGSLVSYASKCLKYTGSYAAYAACYTVTKHVVSYVKVYGLSSAYQTYSLPDCTAVSSASSSATYSSPTTVYTVAATGDSVYRHDVYGNDGATYYSFDGTTDGYTKSSSATGTAAVSTVYSDTYTRSSETNYVRNSYSSYYLASGSYADGNAVVYAGRSQVYDNYMDIYTLLRGSSFTWTTVNYTNSSAKSYYGSLVDLSDLSLSTLSDNEGSFIYSSATGTSTATYTCATTYKYSRTIYLYRTYKLSKRSMSNGYTQTSVTSGSSTSIPASYTYNGKGTVDSYKNSSCTLSAAISTGLTISNYIGGYWNYGTATVTVYYPITVYTNYGTSRYNAYTYNSTAGISVAAGTYYCTSTYDTKYTYTYTGYKWNVSCISATNLKSTETYEDDDLVSYSHSSTTQFVYFFSTGSVPYAKYDYVYTNTAPASKVGEYATVAGANYVYPNSGWLTSADLYTGKTTSNLRKVTFAELSTGFNSCAASATAYYCVSSSAAYYTTVEYDTGTVSSTYYSLTSAVVVPEADGYERVSRAGNLSGSTSVYSDASGNLLSYKPRTNSSGSVLLYTVYYYGSAANVQGSESTSVANGSYWTSVGTVPTAGTKYVSADYASDQTVYSANEADTGCQVYTYYTYADNGGRKYDYYFDVYTRVQSPAAVYGGTYYSASGSYGHDSSVSGTPTVEYASYIGSSDYANYYVYGGSAKGAEQGTYNYEWYTDAEASALGISSGSGNWTKTSSSRNAYDVYTASSSKRSFVIGEVTATQTVDNSSAVPAAPAIGSAQNLLDLSALTAETISAQGTGVLGYDASKGAYVLSGTASKAYSLSAGQAYALSFYLTAGTVTVTAGGSSQTFSGTGIKTFVFTAPSASTAVSIAGSGAQFTWAQLEQGSAFTCYSSYSGGSHCWTQTDCAVEYGYYECSVVYTLTTVGASSYAANGTYSENLGDSLVTSAAPWLSFANGSSSSSTAMYFNGVVSSASKGDYTLASFCTGVGSTSSAYSGTTFTLAGACSYSSMATEDQYQRYTVGFCLTSTGSSSYISSEDSSYSTAEDASIASAVLSVNGKSVTYSGLSLSDLSEDAFGAYYRGYDGTKLYYADESGKVYMLVRGTSQGEFSRYDLYQDYNYGYLASYEKADTLAEYADLLATGAFELCSGYSEASAGAVAVLGSSAVNGLAVSSAKAYFGLGISESTADADSAFGYVFLEDVSGNTVAGSAPYSDDTAGTVYCLAYRDSSSKYYEYGVYSSAEGTWSAVTDNSISSYMSGSSSWGYSAAGGTASYASSSYSTLLLDSQGFGIILKSSYSLTYDGVRVYDAYWGYQSDMASDDILFISSTDAESSRSAASSVFVTTVDGVKYRYTVSSSYASTGKNVEQYTLMTTDSAVYTKNILDLANVVKSGSSDKLSYAVASAYDAAKVLVERLYSDGNKVFIPLVSERYTVSDSIYGMTENQLTGSGSSTYMIPNFLLINSGYVTVSADDSDGDISLSSATKLATISDAEDGADEYLMAYDAYGLYQVYDSTAGTTASYTDLLKAYVAKLNSWLQTEGVSYDSESVDEMYAYVLGQTTHIGGLSYDACAYPMNECEYSFTISPNPAGDIVTPLVTVLYSDLSFDTSDILFVKNGTNYYVYAGISEDALNVWQVEEDSLDVGSSKKYVTLGDVTVDGKTADVIDETDGYSSSEIVLYLSDYDILSNSRIVGYVGYNLLTGSLISSTTSTDYGVVGNWATDETTKKYYTYFNKQAYNASSLTGETYPIEQSRDDWLRWMVLNPIIEENGESRLLTQGDVYSDYISKVAGQEVFTEKIINETDPTVCSYVGWNADKMSRDLTITAAVLLVTAITGGIAGYYVGELYLDGAIAADTYLKTMTAIEAAAVASESVEIGLFCLSYSNDKEPLTDGCRYQTTSVPQYFSPYFFGDGTRTGDIYGDDFGNGSPYTFGSGSFMCQLDDVDGLYFIDLKGDLSKKYTGTATDEGSVFADLVMDGLSGTGGVLSGTSSEGAGCLFTEKKSKAYGNEGYANTTDRVLSDRTTTISILSGGVMNDGDASNNWFITDDGLLVLGYSMDSGRNDYSSKTVSSYGADSNNTFASTLKEKGILEEYLTIGSQKKGGSVYATTKQQKASAADFGRLVMTGSESASSYSGSNAFEAALKTAGYGGSSVSFQPFNITEMTNYDKYNITGRDVCDYAPESFVTASTLNQDSLYFYTNLFYNTAVFYPLSRSAPKIARVGLDGSIVDGTDDSVESHYASVTANGLALDFTYDGQTVGITETGCNQYIMRDDSYYRIYTGETDSTWTRFCEWMTETPDDVSGTSITIGFPEYAAYVSSGLSDLVSTAGVAKHSDGSGDKAIQVSVDGSTVDDDYTVGTSISFTASFKADAATFDHYEYRVTKKETDDSGSKETEVFDGAITRIVGGDDTSWSYVEVSSAQASSEVSSRVRYASGLSIIGTDGESATVGGSSDETSDSYSISVSGLEAGSDYTVEVIGVYADGTISGITSGAYDYTASVSTGGNLIRNPFGSTLAGKADVASQYQAEVMDFSVWKDFITSDIQMAELFNSYYGADCGTVAYQETVAGLPNAYRIRSVTDGYVPTALLVRICGVKDDLTADEEDVMTGYYAGLSSKADGFEVAQTSGSEALASSGNFARIDLSTLGMKDADGTFMQWLQSKISGFSGNAQLTGTPSDASVIDYAGTKDDGDTASLQLFCTGDFGLAISPAEGSNASSFAGKKVCVEYLFEYDRSAEQFYFDYDLDGSMDSSAAAEGFYTWEGKEPRSEYQLTDSAGDGVYVTCDGLTETSSWDEAEDSISSYVRTFGLCADGDASDAARRVCYHGGFYWLYLPGATHGVITG